MGLTFSAHPVVVYSWPMNRFCDIVHRRVTINRVFSLVCLSVSSRDVGLAKRLNESNSFWHMAAFG